MATIKKSVTFDEFVYDTYLLNFGDNFSSYVQKLVILGHEALVNGAADDKKKITSLVSQMEDLKRQIKKLKFDLNKAKNGSTSYDDVVEMHGITESDLGIVRECKKKIDADPGLFDGNFNYFKNMTGRNLRPKEFKALIDGVSQKKLGDDE